MNATASRERLIPDTRLFQCWLVTALAGGTLDLLWRSLVAVPPHAGADPLLTPLFHGVMALALLVFATAPYGEPAGWRRVLPIAAAIGAITYGGLSLRQLADPEFANIAMALVDVAWGALAGSLAAAAGKVWLGLLHAAEEQA